MPPGRRPISARDTRPQGLGMYHWRQVLRSDLLAQVDGTSGNRSTSNFPRSASVVSTMRSDLRLSVTLVRYPAGWDQGDRYKPGT